MSCGRLLLRCAVLRVCSWDDTPPIVARLFGLRHACLINTFLSRRVGSPPMQSPACCARLHFADWLARS